MLVLDRVRRFAQRHPSAKDGISMGNPQRERGMWSFLTWSFFLSQLAVGNAFAGGSAQAASGDGSGPGSSDSAAFKAASVLGPPDFSTFASEAPQSAALHDGAAQSRAGVSATGPGHDTVERLDLTGDASHAMRSFATLDGGASEGGAILPDGPGDGDPGILLPPIVEMPPIMSIPPILDGLVAPILPGIDDLVDSLGPNLDGLLVPVVETVEDLAGVLGPALELAISPVGSLVHGAIAGLEPVLDPLLSPVAGVAEGIGELVQPVDGIAGPLMDLADPIVDAVDPILSPIINVVEAGQPILDPVLDAAAPALDLIAPVVEPLLEPLAPIAAPLLDILPIDIGGGTDVVGPPGSIEFAADPEASIHELFEGGSYTELGLTLHEIPLAEKLGAGDLVEHVVAPIDALLGHDVADGIGHMAPLGGLQHEASLRGLADGLM